MKKALMTLVCVAIAVGLAGSAYAVEVKKDEVKTKVIEKTGDKVTKEKETIKTDLGTEKIKTTTTEKKDSVVTKETDKIKTDAGKEKIKTKVTETKDTVVAKETDKVKTDTMKGKLKETETITKDGTAIDAKITTKMKKGDIVKEKVKFVEYTDKDGGTIIVIKDGKEVKMPAKHYENWKGNVLAKKNKEITIHSTYDPKLLTPVVTHVE